MKHTLRITCFCLFTFFSVNPATAQTVKWQWAQRAGGLGSGGGGVDDQATDIAVDNEGNTYVCGTIYDSFFASFDTTSVPTYGEEDIFISKYNCEGELLWVKIGGNRQGGDYARSIAVDTIRKHLYVSGNIRSNNLDHFKFGNDTTIISGHNDFFLAQLDLQGSLNWLFIGNSRGAGLDISLDSSGYIYAMFSVAGIPAGPFAPGYNLTTGLYLGKFDPSGNLLWVDSLWDSGSFGVTDIDTDPLGNSYISGYIQDTVQIVGQQLISNGTSDGVIIKYDKDGNFKWIRRSNTLAGESNSIASIAVADEDEFYISGGAYPYTRFGSINVHNTGNTGTFGYVIKYENAIPVWGDHIHSSSAVSKYSSIEVDKDGNAYGAGQICGSATIGSVTVTTTGQCDGILTKYDPSNGLTYFINLPGGGNQTDFPNGLTIGYNGNVYLAGSFGSDLQLPDDTIQSVGGNSDIFVAKYGIPQCHDTTTIDTTDGIAELLSGDHLPLLLYPNPSDGSFTIETAEAIDNAVLSLFSATGQLIYREQINRSGRPFKRTFDPELKPGVYFVQLRDGERQYYQKLVVRQP